MSRIQENQRMLDNTKKTPCSSPYEATILGVLRDISKSLAVMADCCLDEWQKNNEMYIQQVRESEASKIIKKLDNLKMEERMDDDGK